MYEKKIDLKSLNTFGGRAVQTDCTDHTITGQNEDIQVKRYTDSGEVIIEGTVYF